MAHAAAMLALLVGTVLPRPVVAQECRGSKQLYAGKCRYPEEIQRLREQYARAKAEVDQRARDQAACEAARQADKKTAWQVYLAGHPNGICREEAERRANAPEDIYEGAPAPPPTEPKPCKPAPLPPPPPVNEEGEEDGEMLRVGIGVGMAGAVIGLGFGVPAFVLAFEDDVNADTAGILGVLSASGAAIAGAGVAVGLASLAGSEDAATADATDTDTAVVLRLTVGPGSLGLTGQF